MTKFIVIFSLAFTCLVSSNSHASEHIATVVAVRGGVTAETAAGKIRKLKMRDLVFRNDTIKTGRRGRIQLLFVDKTIISLARSTVMNIADYSWDKNSKKGEMRTKIKEGTFRIMGGAITKFAPKNFTTETPTATIGIRGSMYAGTVTATSLAVVFQAGKGIDIMNDAGSVAITRPGFGTMVQGLNTAPNPPKKFTAADMSVINDALTGPLEPLQEGTDEQVNDGENAGQQDTANSGETEGNQESGTAEQQTTQQTDSGEATANNGDTAGADGTAPPPDGQAPLPDGGSDGFLPPPDDVSLSGSVDLADPVFNATPLPPAPIPNALDVTSAGLPSNRVLKYSGSFSGSDSVSGSTIQGALYFGLNSRTNKFFGVLEDQGNNTDPNGSPAFIFGSINGTSITNIRIFGSDGGDPSDPQNHVSALTGNGSGYLAGINNDIFNFTASGKEYRLDVGNVVAESNYTVSGTAGRQATGADLVAPTGSALWQGFFVGIAEDVNNIDLNRKRYANTSSSDFSFTVNKDNGTISGSMSGSDFGFPSQSPAGGITSIKIGEAAGAGDSAYIDNGMFGALLGCSTGDCVSTGGTSQGLKPYGNYLVTEDPQKQFSPWLAWGYWEAAFTDDLGHQYHAHVPGTTWIAGEKTPATAVGNLLGNPFVATYNGIAHGTMFDSTGPGAELTGTSTTIIDFGNANVSGNLNLNGSVYNLGGSSYVDSGGFFAQITNAGASSPRTNAVEGAFFGPNAEAVGGNFLFDIGSKSYTGILGGSR
jgi:hypothetical protein